MGDNMKPDYLPWAKREIEVAINNKDTTSYEECCLNTAYRIFENVCKEEYGNARLTKDILVKLIEHSPLIPITDTEEDEKDWLMLDPYTYQNKRYYPLTKFISRSIDSDKQSIILTSYTDNRRYYCRDINNPKYIFYHRTVQSLLDNMFPITMPYTPNKEKIEVVCDAMTPGVFQVIACKLPGDVKLYTINRCFKVDGTEISYEEFMEEHERWK